MAQYIGYVEGQRGQASRLGGKASGLRAQAKGWSIGGTAHISWNEEKQEDEIVLYTDGGSNTNKIPERAEIVASKSGMVIYVEGIVIYEKNYKEEEEVDTNGK